MSTKTTEHKGNGTARVSTAVPKALHNMLVEFAARDGLHVETVARQALAYYLKAKYSAPRPDTYAARPRPVRVSTPLSPEVAARLREAAQAAGYTPASLVATVFEAWLNGDDWMEDMAGETTRPSQASTNASTPGAPSAGAAPATPRKPRRYGIDAEVLDKLADVVSSKGMEFDPLVNNILTAWLNGERYVLPLAGTDTEAVGASQSVPAVIVGVASIELYLGQAMVMQARAQVTHTSVENLANRVIQAWIEGKSYLWEGGIMNAFPCRLPGVCVDVEAMLERAADLSGIPFSNLLEMILRCWSNGEVHNSGQTLLVATGICADEDAFVQRCTELAAAAGGSGA